MARMSSYTLLAAFVLFWLAWMFYLAGGVPPIVFNGQRFLSALLLSALLIGGLAVSVPRLGRVGVLLLGVLLLWVIGTTFINSGGWFAWREVLLVVAIILAARFVAALRVMSGPVFDRPALLGATLFSLGAALIVLQSLLLYAATLPVLQWQLVFEAFFNVRYFSNVQGWTLLLLPAAIHALRHQRGWHVLAWCTAALWWGLFYFSGSRSLLVAVLCGLLLCLCVVGRRHTWWRTAFLCAAAGLPVFLLIRGGLFLLGVEVTDSLEFTRDWWAAGGRWRIWSFVGEQALADLWSGPGNHFLACSDVFGVNHEHNVVMTLLVGWGLPVAVLAIALVLWLLWCFIRTLRASQGENMLLISLLGVWGTVLAESLFSSNYLNPISQLLAVLILGWSWGIVAAHRRINEVGAASTWAAGHASLPIILLSLIALAAMLFMVAVDIHMQETLIFPGNLIRMNFGPRIWAWGGDWCP